MNCIILTNNPLVMKNNAHLVIELVDGELIDVLYKARDLIHLGHHLFSHPLSGSVKPNETIYKSIMISKEPIGFDINSLNIIEQSINLCKSFSKRDITYTETILNDFMLIDSTLISNAINKFIEI